MFQQIIIHFLQLSCEYDEIFIKMDENQEYAFSKETILFVFFHIIYQTLSQQKIKDKYIQYANLTNGATEWQTALHAYLGSAEWNSNQEVYSVSPTVCQNDPSSFLFFILSIIVYILSFICTLNAQNCVKYFQMTASILFIPVSNQIWGLQHFTSIIIFMGGYQSMFYQSEPVVDLSHLSKIGLVLNKDSLLRQSDPSVSNQLVKIINSKQKIGQDRSFNLCFRASQHKFSASKFHQKCNSKKNTLFLSKSTTNNIFGAFTPCQWSNSDLMSYQEDIQCISFLFRVVKNTIEIFQLRKESSKFAIMNDIECGPIYGQGHDIIISDRSNQKESWNNLGKSYNCEYRFGSIKANTTLTDDEKFTLTEYQIWELQG